MTMDSKTKTQPVSTGRKPEKANNYPFDWGGKPSRENRSMKRKWNRGRK